ncbi:MAG TPA: AAA family ATPase [Thermoleophilaceae bacterium]|nr:AAA family ATPase [Thermoleophilaceae bacterium]
MQDLTPSPADAITGRRRELERLEDALRDVEAAEPRAVAIVGEPGIGKTRLLQELTRRAGERGWLVLHGSGSEFEHQLPFGVLLDACGDFLASLDVRTLEQLVGDGRDELATIFPGLRGPDADPPRLPTEERHRAYRRVRELLEGLAEQQPVLLALDDVHWADAASLELIAFLLRRAPQREVGVALAYRAGQAPARLEATIERVGRERGLERIEVGALSAEEAEPLLGTLAAPEREAVYEQAGGNPFYLEQLVRASRGGSVARRGARARRADAITSLVPAAVAGALGQELEALSVGARRLLDGAAVAGDPFEPELATAAAGMGEPEALDALDELLGHDVVRPGSMPRRFHFRHPLLRHAVYEGISAGRRVDAHARAAAAMDDWGQAPERRAHHVEQAATQGDLEAVDVLRRAGHAVAASAPANAARWFDAALSLLPRDEANAGHRLELLLAHASALGALGRLEACRNALVEAPELVPPEAGDMHIALTAACATVEHLMGRHQAATERVEAALGRLEDASGAQAVALTIEQSVAAFFVTDFERMNERAAAAVAGAEGLGDRVLLATAEAMLGYAGTAVGAIDGAVEHQRRAAELVDSLSDAELVMRPAALAHLGWAEFFMERYDDAIRHLERGMSVAWAAGQGQLAHMIREGLGVSMLMRGRLAEARQLFESSVDAARLADNDSALSWALMDVCWAASWQGEPDAAIRAGEEALELARDLGYQVAAATCALATAYLDAGDPTRCVPMIMGGAGGELLPAIPASFKCIFYDALTRAELEQGRGAEADRWAERAEDHAKRLGLATALAEANRARARVLLHEGTPAPAAELALQAVQQAAGAGAVIESARSRVVAGRALAGAGRRDAALAALEAAAEELQACGAGLFRAEALRELCRLGARAAPDAARAAAVEASLAGLSERERGIAELVADRKTNREIADDLFLGVKTVESHMRNIFRKLGVSSRVEVARLVERERREATRADARAG